MDAAEAKQKIANVVNSHQRSEEANYCGGCYAGYYNTSYGDDKFDIGRHVADMIEKEFS